MDRPHPAARPAVTRYRVGVDIGGTFTDIVALDPEGRVHTKKVSSTVDNYAHAIVAGLGELFRETGLGGGDMGEVMHGTTVASNAVLELRGARTGLITTRGFRDVLEIRRLRMPRLYDLGWEKPVPLVERYLRAEVDERVNARGEVVRALDPAEVERVLDRLLGEGIEALAVCLINSYANPAHEELVQAVVRRRAPDLPLCISAEVLPEVKEYERTSTTVINTYVMPIVQRYLSTLREGLVEIGIAAPLLIMQSNGGLTTAAAAERMPMHVIESGPAAGVVGARAVARRSGLAKVITFDMGGTTAKASIVEDGELNRASEYQVGGGIMVGSRLLTGAGYLLRVPAIDLAEVGAGGGSIVWIDAGGALQAGPRSAGAAPGPVSYDLGGTEPTITDANVILGYLNPAHLVGGALKLNAARAHAVFEERVARPLGFDLAQAAYGAHLIAASNMIRAIKAVSSERGRDPREYALFAFGGNGPLFAAGMARALEMRTIVVPPAPGLFSSFGLLYSDVEHHYVRTFRRNLRGLDPTEFGQVVDRMRADGLAQLAADGFTGEAARLEASADLRYHGQSYELTVPVPAGRIDRAVLVALEDAFGREHERTYGHRAEAGEPVEMINLRLAARGIPSTSRVPERVDVVGPARSAREAEPGGDGPPPGPHSTAAAGSRFIRRVYFGPEDGWLDTPILARGDLAVPREGPCIVEEYDATCVVPPRAEAALDAHGNIVIDVAG